MTLDDCTAFMSGRYCIHVSVAEETLGEETRCKLSCTRWMGDGLRYNQWSFLQIKDQSAF